MVSGQCVIVNFICCVHRWTVREATAELVATCMGSRFTGALAFANDITLLAPCKLALSIFISVCEDYAAEYYITLSRAIY